VTIDMPDSVTVANLPAGYQAYLGYWDGDYPTAEELDTVFPDADHVILTVHGGLADNVLGMIDGFDVENGDMTATAAADLAYRKIRLTPDEWPVIYASVSTMKDLVLPALAVEHIDLRDVRLLSAHYGKGPHICGPGSCGEISVEMDGTQWTSTFAVRPGVLIDMSMLKDDFFGPQITPTEAMVRELPVLQQGAAGPLVKTVQGLCNARGATLAIDGVFGAQTQHAVLFTQSMSKLVVDGVVGPATWPALLGIA
jgi:hypothetical protein